MANESATPDPHRIRTAEDLRELIGEVKPGIQIKLETELDDYSIEFIERCPFLVLSTASADGRQDASPKGDAPGFALVEDSRTLVIPVSSHLSKPLARPKTRFIQGPATTPAVR